MNKMVNIGFIGAGHMGGTLLKSLVKSGAVKAADVIASDPARERLETINKGLGFRIAKDNNEVAKNSDVVFLCVKPLQVRSVLMELKGDLNSKKLLVSIAAGVKTKRLETWTFARIVRLIPSITISAGGGISLLHFGSRSTEDDRKLITEMLSKISKPAEIAEKDFEVSTDLTSCAPGLISAMMDEFSKSGVRNGLSDELATELVMETLFYTAKNLRDRNMKFSDLVEQVATKGGITEEGVNVLKDKLPSVFDEVMEKTLAKYVKLNEMLEGQG